MDKREENHHLNRLKRGNLHSFKWLYRYHYERVYFFCLSLSKSPLDAEEITSDVFVKIWEKRAQIDPTVSLKPLLFKITKDLTWNYLKRTARKQELRERFFQNYFGQAAYHSEDDILFQEYLDIINQAVEKLSPQQQKIFTLRYLGGRKINQIAQELSISKNTVKVHLTNSKRLVLNYLRDHAGIEVV